MASQPDRALVDAGPPPGPEPEACNGLDDDLDGVTDEIDAVWCTSDEGDMRELVGICRPGRRRCVNGAWGACEDEVGPRPEMCNQLDDDCDGRVDESFDLAADLEHCGACGRRCEAPNSAPACVDGQCVYPCLDGFSDCNGDPTDGCETEGKCPPDAECNGVDNDHDGRVDEDYVPMGCGTGLCADTATESSCDNGQETPCEAGQPIGDDIICNGRDEDCDGRVDEAFRPEPCGLGVCGQRSELSSCVDGQFVACEEGPSRVEACNGLDDDCDGEVDDGFDLDIDPQHCGACGADCSRPAAPTTCEQGECVLVACDPGFSDCNGDLADGCETAGECPDDSDCDGIDQDRDGRVDEGYVPVERCGRGTCADDAAPSRCEAGMVIPCVPGAAQPDDRLCNGADEDCDGRLDEGYVPQGCGVGQCAASATPSACQEGVEVPCAPGDPSPETCNALDDDCDGEVDDSFPVMERCEVGVGECYDDGFWLCADDGGVECSAVAREPLDVEDRICDGRDGDCDGAADEGFVVETCGDGECRRAASPSVCEAGVFTACVPGQPEDEACNALDDDCDGQADEGFGLLEGCAVGVGVCRAEGVMICDGHGGTRCSVDSGAPIEPEDRTCDGQDGDCDGAVDEDFEPVLCGLGACGVGAQPSACEAGEVLACVPGLPERELCNGVDDDCDGVVDNAPIETTVVNTPDVPAARPRITWGGGQFYLSWIDRLDPFGQEEGSLWLRSVDSGGAPFGEPFEVHSGRRVVSADMAWGENDLYLAWQRYEANGPCRVHATQLSRLNERIRVDVSESSSHTPAIAWRDGHATVVWHDDRGNPYDLELRSLGPDLARGDVNRAVRSNNSDRVPDIVTMNDGLAMVWQRGRRTFDEPKSIYLGRLSDDGQIGGIRRIGHVVDGPFPRDTYHLLAPRMASSGDSVAIAWVQEVTPDARQVVLALEDPGIDEPGSTLIVSTEGAEVPWGPVPPVYVDGLDIWAIAWRQLEGETGVIYVRFVDRDGTLLGDPIAISDPRGDASTPDATWSGEQLAVAYRLDGDFDGELHLTRVPVGCLIDR